MNLFTLLVLAVIAYFVWSRQRARAAHQEEVLALVEERAKVLVDELPDLDDEAIALLLRDELQNRRVKDHDAYVAASGHTVGRVRRTLHLANERARKKAPKKLPPARIHANDDED